MYMYKKKKLLAKHFIFYLTKNGVTKRNFLFKILNLNVLLYAQSLKDIQPY